MTPTAWLVPVTPTARILSAFGGLSTAYFLARAAWYGQWPPNTFYVKAGAPLDGEQTEGR